MPIRILGALLALLPCLSAQVSGPGTLLFSPRTTAVTLAGASGSSNSAMSVGRQGILVHSPSAGIPSAHPIADACTFGAFFGDDDGDGDFGDFSALSIDAVHHRSFVAGIDPPTIFECIVSFGSHAGSAGLLGATGEQVHPGDLVRLFPGGVLHHFMSATQIAAALGTATRNFDVDAFTIDVASGDLYLSFETTVSVNGNPASDGALVRIPGSALTLSATQDVVAVTPGSALIALDENEVAALFAGAGQQGLFDLRAIEIDPAGGSFVASSGSLPNFWMSGGGAGTTIVSTRGQGSLASLNGLPLQTPAALGLVSSPWAGLELDGLAFKAADMVCSPLFIDSPQTLISTANATSFSPVHPTVDLGGGSAQGTALLLCHILSLSPGAWLPRYQLPIPACLFPELYLNPLDLLGCQIPIALDSQGKGSFSLPIDAPLPLRLDVVFQAADLATLRLSPPLVLSLTP